MISAYIAVALVCGSLLTVVILGFGIWRYRVATRRSKMNIVAASRFARGTSRWKADTEEVPGDGNFIKTRDDEEEDDELYARDEKLEEEEYERGDDDIFVDLEELEEEDMENARIKEMLEQEQRDRFQGAAEEATAQGPAAPPSGAGAWEEADKEQHTRSAVDIRLQVGLGARARSPKP